MPPTAFWIAVIIGVLAALGFVIWLSTIMLTSGVYG